ncbi:MAG: cytochrome b/b6 domain-containing protein [Anaerolineae bacterium]
MERVTRAATGTAEAVAVRELPRGALETGYIVRFDVHQRVQHVVMISSFLVLVLTGFPQKFPQLEVCQWLMDVMGGLQTVRFIHRLAGSVMIFVGLYHVCYVAYTVLVLKRTGPLRMIPNPKDYQDAVRMVQYFLGVTTQKPKFDRFSYLEKFDYWAVFWGMAVMVGSGLILLFPVAVARVLPGQAVIAAFRAHSDEALLAVTWIFIVHIFYAHLAPRVFPFNPAIFTGRLPAGFYREEHPLEYERLVEAGQVVVPQQSGTELMAPSAPLQGNPNPEETSETDPPLAEDRPKEATEERKEGESESGKET